MPTSGPRPSSSRTSATRHDQLTVSGIGSMVGVADRTRRPKGRHGGGSRDPDSRERGRTESLDLARQAVGSVLLSIGTGAGVADPLLAKVACVTRPHALLLVRASSDAPSMDADIPSGLSDQTRSRHGRPDLDATRDWCLRIDFNGGGRPDITDDTQHRYSHPS